MNSLMTVLYLDAQKAEYERQLRTRLRESAPLLRPERRSRRWF